MYILYIDESGDGGMNPRSSRYLVLAGAAMHEGQWKRLTKSLDSIQRTYFPQAGTAVEFHASDLRGGRRAFRKLTRLQRARMMGEIYKAVAITRRGLVLFAAVIDKPAFIAKYQGRVEPYRGAFEGLCTMFNYFLRRMEKKTGNVLRGIVVLDEARPSLSKQIRTLLAGYHASGTRWTKMTNLIETAFFFDSRSSRMVQIADFCAYAVYRWHEANDDSYLRVLHHKFDRHAKKIHGLKCYPVESTKNYPPTR